MQQFPPWARYAVALAIALLILIVIAIQVSNRGPAAPVPTMTLTAGPTQAVTVVTVTVVVSPTETSVPTAATTIPATATLALLTATPVPPTATPVPPTSTPVPPTATRVPPTATPVPPTATRVPPTATPQPPPTTETCKANGTDPTHCSFPVFGVTIDVPSQTPPRALDLTATNPGSVPPSSDNPKLTVIRAVMNLQITSGSATVLQFKPPLTVAVQYGDADLQPVGGDPNRLKLFLYDGTRWSELAKPQVNTAAKTLTVQLSALLSGQDRLGIAY
jgi:hypothetical protein